MGLLADSPIPSGFTGARLGVCNLCEAICGLRVTFTDGEVTGIRGNPEDPLSRGHVCPKGVSLADVHADPDRLRRPVRRVGTGEDADMTQEEIDAAKIACFEDATVASGVEGYQRKLQELRYAIALEQKYSKDEILLGYLNIANFGGQNYGIGAAAHYYFA